MRIPVWTEGMTPEQEREIAYAERNLLALGVADGWYIDPNGSPWFSRVLSIKNGRMTFHIPDDFDVGNLPQIEPNWDGHTTEEKWRLFFALHDITVTEEQ